MLNSYLASIAVRTVRPEAALRPRLRARFEPGPIAPASLNERSDFAVSSHPVQRNPREDQNPAFETPQRPSAVRKSTQSRLPAPPRSPEVIASSRENEVAPAPRGLDQFVEPTLRVTVRPRRANQRTRRVPEATLQTELEKPIDQHWQRSAKPLISTPTEKDRAPRTEALFTKPLPTSLGRREEGARPTAAQDSSHKITSLRDHENEPRTVQQTKPGTETKLETIVVREKVSANESLTPPAPVSVPGSEVPPENKTGGNPVARPVLLQSRIALPIEPAPEVHASTQSPEVTQPTVHVTIGRIEVRAVQAAQSPPKSRAAPPVMNLDDYLKRRSQGGPR